MLVEGISDQEAVRALAERHGRNLDAEGVSVIPIGGAQAIGRFLDRYGPSGLNVRLAGLCDAGEEPDFRGGLERAGLGFDLTREDLERLGFFVCDADLEEELIRALGAQAVERVVEAHGDLRPFPTLQKQPNGKDDRSRSNFGDSWAAGAGGRSATHGFSSKRSSSTGCRVRSTACSHMSPTELPREQNRIRARGGQTRIRD